MGPDFKQVLSLAFFERVLKNPSWPGARVSWVEGIKVGLKQGGLSFVFVPVLSNLAFRLIFAANHSIFQLSHHYYKFVNGTF